MSNLVENPILNSAFEEPTRYHHFEALPFPPGNKIAVKVIDHRGNETLQVFATTEGLQ